MDQDEIRRAIIGAEVAYLSARDAIDVAEVALRSARKTLDRLEGAASVLHDVAARVGVPEVSEVTDRHVAEIRYRLASACAQ